MKEQRQAAADRRRRIIYNNDGGDATRRITRPSPEDMLAVYMNGVIGTQVDSIFYSTGPSGFGLFTHFTKVGQILTCREGSLSNNQVPAFLEKGIDPFQVNIDFARRHNLEIFWSMRMNDTHDGAKQAYGPIRFNFNQLKVNHPEYLMGTKTNPPKHGTWTAVNYGRPEIRELAFRYVEEVCTNYNVDGVELDFYRHPVFFKSTSRGELATDEDRGAMTGLLRRIRAMADVVGKKRGRPILVAVHAPDSVEYCRAIGLDLEYWMQEDLLDLWMAGGSSQLNDWDYSVALARKHKIKVYPSLDDIRVRDEIAAQMRRVPLGYRARAANAWAVGMDGVYLFNPPEAIPSIHNELGDPKALARMDRDYFGSFLGMLGSSGGNLPLDSYQKAETLNGRIPKLVAPGKTMTSRIYIAEDLANTSGVRLKLRLRFEPTAESRPLTVEFNNQKPKLLQAQDQWLEFDLPASLMKRGANDVKVTLAAEATSRAKWTDVLIEVRNVSVK